MSRSKVKLREPQDVVHHMFHVKHLNESASHKSLYWRAICERDPTGRPGVRQTGPQMSCATRRLQEQKSNGFCEKFLETRGNSPPFAQFCMPYCNHG